MRTGLQLTKHHASCVAYIPYIVIFLTDLSPANVIYHNLWFYFFVMCNVMVSIANLIGKLNAQLYVI